MVVTDRAMFLYKATTPASSTISLFGLGTDRQALFEGLNLFGKGEKKRKRKVVDGTLTAATQLEVAGYV
jgi:hypothetical protein